MLAQSDTMLRRVAPTHRSFYAAMHDGEHNYQPRAVEHLCERGSAMLWLDPGMGKTGTVLYAFKELLEHGMVQTMLVIAPLRVCQLVWRQEAQDWTEFRDLKFSPILGSVKQREKALAAPADVYLINYENLPWLCDLHGGTRRMFGRNASNARMPFDVLCFDEVTRVKNPRAERSRRMHEFADKARYRWGLTGTPNPNGYMDLFGQFRMIDGGAALGKYISHYRDRFFVQSRNGFDWDLQPGAAARIEAAIKPYVFRASADDYLKLPPLVEHKIEVDLDDKVRKAYKAMKRDMIAQLPGGVLTAANAAAVQSKLAQMANGAVYTTHPKWEHLHDAKLDALKALVEELQGEPLLVGYEFGHDLERILRVFPAAPRIAGANEKQIQKIEDDWNAGKIPVLPAHPASIGHGLNMQKGHAQHLCWFGQTWDLELYDQFIRRIRRQGSKAQRIIEHSIIVRESIDGSRRDALRDKDDTQGRLLRALKSEFERDEVKLNIEGENDMRRIGSPGAVAPQAPAPVEPAPQQTQGGWGEQPAPQRNKVKSKISSGAPAPQAPSAGWGDSAPQQTGQAISTGGERVDPVQNGDAPKPRTRRASNKEAATTQPETVTARVQPEGDIARVCAPDLELTDYKITFDIAAFLAAWTAAGADYDEGVEEAFKLVHRLRGKPF